MFVEQGRVLSEQGVDVGPGACSPLHEPGVLPGLQRNQRLMTATDINFIKFPQNRSLSVKTTNDTRLKKKHLSLSGEKNNRYLKISSEIFFESLVVLVTTVLSISLTCLPWPTWPSWQVVEEAAAAASGRLLPPPLSSISSCSSARLWQRGGVEHDDNEEVDRLARRLSEEEIRWSRFSLAVSFPPSSWRIWSRSVPRLRHILLLTSWLSLLGCAKPCCSTGLEAELSLDSTSSRLSRRSPVG